MNKQRLSLFKKKIFIFSFLFLIFSPKLAYSYCQGPGTSPQGISESFYDADSGCYVNIYDYIKRFFSGPFEYIGDNSGIGATVGGIAGGVAGGAIGSGFGGTGNVVGGYIGGNIGASIGDSLEGKGNKYAEDRWNNKKDNSTSWRRAR